MPAYISGIGVFLPNEPVANSEIENVLGQVGGSRSRTKDIVLHSNGITSRYYAIDPATGRMTHTNRELTAEAIRALCERTGFRMADLECLSCGTTTPDQMLPNHAAMVHAGLGAPPCEVVSTTGACASGVTAFKYGCLSVLSGRRNVISTASELLSVNMRASHFESGHRTADIGDAEAAARLRANPMVALEADFLRWMLSDGAAAVLITDEPRGGSVSLRVDWIEIVSMAHYADPCMYWGAEKGEDGTFTGWRQAGSPGEALARGDFYLKQDARQLGELITKLGGESFDVLRERREIRGEEYDWFLPHYSSEFFREPTAEILRSRGVAIPREKWFTNLTYKGNTGAASVFIMLEELLNGGRLSPGQKILCHVPESARFTYAYIQLTVV